MRKFKVTMAQNSKSIPEWIEDTIEELIDATCYLSTLKDRINKRENDLLKENDRLRDELTINELLSDKKDKQIEDLKLQKINEVELAKKEADKLMIKKITMYESKLAKYGKKTKVGR
jgi:organic radical activating enzyme